MLVEANVEGTIINIHKRVIKMPDLFREVQQVYNANPYWEPEKHPVIGREFKVGIEHVLLKLPFLKNNENCIKSKVDYGLDETTLTFYLELL